jgi:hypothetical protein
MPIYVGNNLVSPKISATPSLIYRGDTLIHQNIVERGFTSNTDGVEPYSNLTGAVSQNIGFLNFDYNPFWVWSAELLVGSSGYWDAVSPGSGWSGYTPVNIGQGENILIIFSPSSPSNPIFENTPEDLTVRLDLPKTTSNDGLGGYFTMRQHTGAINQASYNIDNDGAYSSIFLYVSVYGSLFTPRVAGPIFQPANLVVSFNGTVGPSGLPLP